jgi:hypothetical protein
MMTPSVPLHLTAEDKLDALRHLDHGAPWTSLDDQRYCLRCSHVITGRQIEVTGGTRPLGPLRLACPTEGCTATPNEWVLPVHRRKRTLRRSAKPEGLQRPQRKSTGWFGHAAFSFVRQIAGVATDCRSVLSKLRPFPPPRFSSLL